MVDERNIYLGAVALQAATSVLLEAHVQTRPCARDLMHIDSLDTMTPDIGVAEALQRFVDHRGERLPMTQSDDNPHLLGVVYKTSRRCAMRMCA